MRKPTLLATGLLLPTILVAACSRAPAPAANPSAPAPDGTPPIAAPVTAGGGPAQVYSPGQPAGRDGQLPAPAVTEAGALLPKADIPVTYLVQDHGAEAAPVQEHLLREGDRAIAVANGRAYAVWEIRPDGVWRADPRNPGILLRYLPAQLSNGQYWRQRSGDADVWFRLSIAGPCDQTTASCWELVVLNRGERTVFRFGESAGPISAQADNWAEPARSFHKYIDPGAAPGTMTASQRTLLLQGLAAPATPAPVTEATADQFEEAVFHMLTTARPALQTLRLDLNGDERLDLVQGRLDEWTTAPLRFYHGDGRSAGYPWTPGKGRMRVTRLPFPNMRVPAFLVERPDDGDFRAVSIVTARENPYMNTWEMESVYGWAPKASGDIADRVSWTADGTITVEWDMQDPARHTRVSTYTWTEDHQAKWSLVMPQSVAYRPEEEALRYPATPNEVLQAAFVARWLGLTDELPRYFATPEAAAAFAADERIGRPDYRPGGVQIGTLTLPEDPTRNCGPKVAAVEPQGPGPHTFAAFWGGYEWCASTWGRVTFGVDADRRPVITELLLDGAGVSG
jgi:hypothetical protein